jgi:hypothetical protein
MYLPIKTNLSSFSRDIGSTNLSLRILVYFCKLVSLEKVSQQKQNALTKIYQYPQQQISIIRSL